MTFRIYCDGASRKDGRGGWGYVVYRGVSIIQRDYGGEFATTNNRMELLAAIRALEYLPANSVATVFSDSQYLVKGITEYLDTWLRAKWRTSGNNPVVNQDLWEALGHLDCDHRITWEWVRGHTGNTGNEEADRLAGLGVPKQVPALLR